MLELSEADVVVVVGVTVTRTDAVETGMLLLMLEVDPTLLVAETTLALVETIVVLLLPDSDVSPVT